MLAACCLLVSFSRAWAAPFSWDAKTQGGFVMSLARDGAGAIWAGTEDKGVWRFQNGKWTQWTTKDGLGDDNAYALAIDRQNRVWVGHLDHGVSVFNGASWKNYDIYDGPLGERVYDIKVCPTDGDVWIATDAGLTRYSVSKDKWSYLTRADGLPSDQIQAIAFDTSGNIVVGTQCDGVALADAKDNYAKWRVVAGPDDVPTEPNGEGLPSGSINDVLVAQGGAIYVATTSGLASSDDKGLIWNYTRGADWADKVRGRFIGAPNKRWQPKNGATLSEDRVTCLAQDNANRLWLAHWRGYEAFDTKTNERVVASANEKEVANADDWVCAILPLPDAPPLLARYGSGVAQLKSFAPTVAKAAVAPAAVATANSPDMSTHGAAFPSPAAPPTTEELEDWTKKVGSLKKFLPVGAALYLGDDWRTHGDWIGRYGRQRAVLCAISAPFNRVFSSDIRLYPDIIGQIGPHHSDDDSLRHWLQSEDARVLYDPMIGHRREAEWDDHAEAYANTFEGPDLWISIGVPSGAHRVSCYFFNKDGHEGANRLRDYGVELRAVREALPPWPETPEAGPDFAARFKQVFADYWAKRYQIVARADAETPLAQARVRDFWGGAYKSFLVRGPSKYWIKVAKNNSFNTILQAVFIDRLADSTSWDGKAMGLMGGVRINPPDPDAPPAPDPHALETFLAAHAKGAPLSTHAALATDQKRIDAARTLWRALDASLEREGNEGWQWRGRMLALRAIQNAGASDALIENWRWKLALWTPTDRATGRETAARAYDSLLELNPEMKGKAF